MSSISNKNLDKTILGKLGRPVPSVAILSGKGHTAATLAALANYGAVLKTQPAIKGPIAATPAVAAALTSDSALKFARELGEHYKHRALTAEAKLKVVQDTHTAEMQELNAQLTSLQGQFRALLEQAKELTNAAG
jgi:hypothetical protein